MSSMICGYENCSNTSTVTRYNIKLCNNHVNIFLNNIRDFMLQEIRHSKNFARPSFDEYFLEIALAVAKRGDCTRSQVGAILVDQQRRIISTGYNGVSPGAPGCLSGACPRGKLSYEQLPPTANYSNCISFHAEKNCLIWSDPEKRVGSFLYVTRSPCRDCQKLAMASGIKKFIWLTPDKKIASMLLFY